MPPATPDTKAIVDEAAARVEAIVAAAEVEFADRVQGRLMERAATSADVLGPIPFGGFVVFRGVEREDVASLRADLQAAAGHSQFTVIVVPENGTAEIIGDAKMHEAIVASLSDSVHEDLVNRAEKHFVDRVQPILEQVQAAASVE